VSGKLIYSARVIPIRGSWLDLEFDPKDLLYARIDRRRKMPVTVLLRAMGYSAEELMEYFYDIERVILNGSRISLMVEGSLIGERVPEDIKDNQTGEVLLKKGRKISKAFLKKMADAGVELMDVSEDYIVGKVLASDVVDPETGDVLLKCTDELSADGMELLRRKKHYGGQIYST